MHTVLITGASRGIGLEFTRQYLARGSRVIACCRLPDCASALQALAAPALDVVGLDVSDSAAVAALPAKLAGNSLDLFINNAGVYGDHQGLADADWAQWLDVFSVNVIGPLMLTRALLPLMAVNAKLVYLSSKMGSISDNTGGGAYIYRSSKTALNQVIRSLSIDLAGQGLSVAALHPGWVQTDMGGPNALIDTGTSVSGLMGVIDRLNATGSGRFFNYNGEEIPW
jgi:NAD(P)-dependent dehydrogenase (short-subunit alcohol dehydrogenase family)